MTSRNSFWASCRENHKRRIWVWIVALILQLLVYGGMTIVYLSRIRGYYEEGTYRTVQAFREAMYQAARDALGFSDNVFPFVIFLGAIIGMQGFSYLYDRRKVDLYHSVPVAKSRRFAAVYVNGLTIYFVSGMVGLLCGMILAGAQGAVNALVLADAGMAFLWNLLLFLVCYHMMILAVMVTGSRFVTVCVFLVFSLFEPCFYEICEAFSLDFYDTYAKSFTDSAPKFSAYYDCITYAGRLKDMTEVGEKAKVAFPIMGRWLLLAAVFLAFAWIAYRRRASEAAGKSIAFSWLKPVLKVAVGIPGALLIGALVYDASHNSETLMAMGIIVSAILLCAALEVLYAFDIRCIIKNLPSTGIVVVGALAIFCTFKWDLTGYDSYIPKQNKVESIAILLDCYYDEYWGENRQYIPADEYIKENMFLTDAEPVLALAQMAQQTDIGDMGQGRTLHVLYRLKSGREKVRRVVVDYNDPQTEAYLNRIFQSDEFQHGIFQMMTDENYCDGLTKIRYSNGPVRATIPAKEAEALRTAWIRDMEQFDFTMAKDVMPCGQITMDYADYSYRQWYVYDTFAETIACLEKNEAFYPAKLNAKDIDYITVTNYHNELMQEDMEIGIEAREEAQAYDVDYTVKETFSDQAQIEQILSASHSTYLVSPWGNYEGTENNYSVEVVFKKDSAYPYDRNAYYFNYEFIKGQVPDFVAEATEYIDIE